MSEKSEKAPILKSKPKENPKTTDLAEEGIRRLYEDIARKEIEQNQLEIDRRGAEQKLKLAENFEVYQKALKLIQSTGKSEKEAELILNDYTNVYVGKLMDLIEKNRRFSEVLKRVTNWQKSILPELKEEILAKGFPENFVEKVLDFGHFPQVERFIDDPHLHDQPLRARNELRFIAERMKNGAGFEEIAQELNQKIPVQKASKEVELDEQYEIEGDQEKRKARNETIDALMNSMPELDYLKEKVKLMDGAKPMEPEELANFLGDLEANVLDPLSLKVPGLKEVNESIKNNILDMEATMAQMAGEGASAEEIKQALNDINTIDDKALDIVSSIKRSGNKAHIAALNLYEGSIEAMVETMYRTYIK